MIRAWRPFRALLVSCALSAISARAFDVNDCQDSGGPRPDSCSSRFSPQPQEAYQAAHDPPTAGKVFDPKQDGFRQAIPSPAPLALANTAGLFAFGNLVELLEHNQSADSGPGGVIRGLSEDAQGG